MRPCSEIVDRLEVLDAEVEIRGRRRRADARSILDLLCLAADGDTELAIYASGPDAARAVEEVYGVLVDGHVSSVCVSI